MGHGEGVGLGSNAALPQSKSYLMVQCHQLDARHKLRKARSFYNAKYFAKFPVNSLTFWSLRLS